MSTRKGKAFEYEWSRSLKNYQARHDGFFWRRWPDYQDFIRINKKLRAPRAPADFVAVYNGEFYAFELKSSRASRYHCAWVKDHQKDTLLHVKQAGGHGLLVLNRRKPTMDCWAIDVADFIWLEVKSREDGYKSISWDDIMGAGTEIPRVRGAWDLSVLFQEGADSSL